MTLKKLLWGLLLTGNISAFSQTSNLYFNPAIKTGYSNLTYTLKEGTHCGVMGYGLDLRAGAFLPSGLGIQTGIDFESISSSGTFNTVIEAPDIDSDGDSYILNTEYNDWQEVQNALYLSIPLGLQQIFQNQNRCIDFIFSAGWKINIPLYSHYKVKSGSITTTGYYEQWNVELYDLPQHGFTTISNRYKGNLTAGTVQSLFLDFGMIYGISNQTDLYLGLYLNYSFQAAFSDSDNELYSVEGTYNSIITTSYADAANLFSFGLKIGMAMHKWINNKPFKCRFFKRYQLVFSGKHRLYQPMLSLPPPSHDSENANEC